MSLLMARGLSLAFGKKVILDDASFAIGPHDRIGLIGANGTGKSSLLKILSGTSTPDSGDLVFRRGVRVGYLPQELAGTWEGTLLESVLRAVPGRDTLEQRISDTESTLANESLSLSENDQLELAQDLADLHAEYESFEERHGPHRAQRLLQGLGFSADAMQRPAAALSGGWRMRGALAALLLQDPDLLLLDEPTNHLDVPTLAWFDAFMRQSTKARILISHDRDFLNRQIDRVLSLEPEGLRAYSGNYERYRELRSVESEQLEAAAARQQARRAEVEAFVDRFGAKATKARQAQSKLKQLEKEEIIVVREQRDVMRFRFPASPRAPREIATLTEVQKRYGDKTVFSSLNARVDRGNRIGVVGPNGAGKTTLLKLLASEIEPDAGEVKLTDGVVLGYYAQHHAERLDPTKTILDEMQKHAPTSTPAQLRQTLGAFLFSGDDVDKPTRVLSGGERARVALAKLLVVPSNFMLMDEPTNHLDLDSSERLIEALRDYQGTLLFVSHNRSFVNQLASEIWEVTPEGLVVYPGNLDEYLHKKRMGSDPEPTPAAPKAPPASKESDKDRRRREAEGREKRASQERPLRKESASLEKEIQALEAEQQSAEAQLADPALYADFARSQPLVTAHRERAEKIQALYKRWEKVEAQLASLS